MSIPSNYWKLQYPQADQKAHRVELSGAMQRVCDSGSYILGAEVSAFETEFAAFLGAAEAVGVASGTDAIELMLRALDIGAGCKVVVPSFAPSAVASGVARSGAEPVFADIEADTFTLCPESLDALLRSYQGRGVKAAVVVHLYGHPADWRSLQQVAMNHQTMQHQQHLLQRKGRKVQQQQRRLQHQLRTVIVMMVGLLNPKQQQR